MRMIRLTYLVGKIVNMERRVTLGEAFLQLNLDKSAKIIDVACGTGAVALELVPEGYTNIDGLDPMKGYLEVAKERKLYQEYFHLSVVPGYIHSEFFYDFISKTSLKV